MDGTPISVESFQDNIRTPVILLFTCFTCEKTLGVPNQRVPNQQDIISHATPFQNNPQKFLTLNSKWIHCLAYKATARKLDSKK